uniref:Uncharacterized protein n=1 Tax=Anguilla anguilla TaxID=7936 RepID=A0A0E9RMS9_ANGAN
MFSQTPRTCSDSDGPKGVSAKSC